MRVQTGSEILDGLLEGGYENDIITSIYGPAGSGKTLICMLSALSMARNGKKVIYVDSEGGWSFERAAQIARDCKKLLNKIIFLKPTSFAEQMECFDKLKGLVDNRIGLIVIDTISMLYRLELGKDNVQEINREMGMQLGWLNEIARKENIPVLVANQVYSSFEDKDKVCIVGGDLLRYSSKCLIELQSLAGGNKRAILRKHRSVGEKTVIFRIAENGIVAAKESTQKLRFWHR
ncbi:MAG: DNA repair and recombination protein RadB [Candidatus Nanoarchaeia archaeon]